MEKFSAKKLLAVPLSILLALSLNCKPSVAVGIEKPKELIPLGFTVGVKLFSDGVIVVGISKIQSGNNAFSPAQNAGISVGDIITHIGDEKVNTADEVILALQSGKKVSVTYSRNGKTMQTQITPAKAGNDGFYKLGIWVRDSIAGIGTMTFYDPESGIYGALGHGINDVDTQLLMPLLSGSIMESTVKSIIKGENGKPGELVGEFNLQQDCGLISVNCSTGIFGSLIEKDRINNLEAIPVAADHEVKTGDAYILSNVSGNHVSKYHIEITAIDLFSGNEGQNMTIRVTDPELIELTGGIVQGMSGSPIIQNGKLVGAVTHVLVNDPTRGYGILIDRMLNDAFGANLASAA